MADWQLTLHDSRTMDQIVDIPYAVNRLLKLLWNGAGSVAFDIALEDEVAYLAQIIKTCVKVKRNGASIWSGPIWTRNGSMSSGKMSITCVGWLEAQVKRELIEDEMVFTTDPDWQIARDMTDEINSQDADHPLRIDFGGHSGSSFQTRTRTYTKGQDLKGVLTELSTTEAGYDIWVDPDTKMYYCTSSADVVDRPNAVFTNLADAGFAESAESFTNDLTVAGAPGVTPGHADDPASIAEYGLCNNTISLPDVGDNNILAAKAGEEIIVQMRGPDDPVARPPLTYDIKASDSDTDPVMFDDYEIGDRVYFSAKRGAFEVDRQAIRPWRTTVDMDNDKVTELEMNPA